MEKAETGSIGRALAYCGYGTQFAASELEEAPERPVDAPISPAGPQKPAEPELGIAPDPRADLLKEFIRMGTARGMKRVKELTAHASDILGRDIGKTMDSISSLSLEDLTKLTEADKTNVASSEAATAVQEKMTESWGDPA